MNMFRENKNIEWSTIFEEFEDHLKETAKLILSDSEENSQEELQKLRSTMKMYEDTKRKILLENSVLDNLKQSVNSMETPWECDIHKEFEDRLLAESQHTQLDSQGSDGFDKFINNLKDLVVGSQDTAATTHKDPWTKLPIKDPVQSDKCKHFYERKVVLMILKKKKEFRCPYLGCVHIVKEGNIVDVDSQD